MSSVPFSGFKQDARVPQQLGVIPPTSSLPPSSSKKIIDAGRKRKIVGIRKREPEKNRLDDHLVKIEHNKPERTSTPLKTAQRRRLSEVFKEFGLSPVTDENDMRFSKHLGVCQPLQPTPCKKITRASVFAKNKLGKPLLSSTKLHESMECDNRLLNAVCIYQQRLGVELDSQQADLITSQLLHENAMVDTILSCGD